MESHDTNQQKVLNGYEPRSAIRTFLGVAASMLIMGLPVGMTEAIRPGGDGHVALWGLVCAAIAVVFGYLSIHGTMKE